MYEFKKDDIYLFKNAIGNPPTKEKGYEILFRRKDLYK